MRTWILGILLPIVLLGADPPIVVDVAILPPNVMEAPGQEEKFEGFDIELWEEIARNVGIEYTLRRVPFDQLLEEVGAGEAAVGLAGITIRGDRERVMDFSYPYMQSGLTILTNVGPSGDVAGIGQAILESDAAKWVFYLILFLILCAHLLYFAERGTTAVDRRYFPGIFEAAWCIVATITTVGYGDVTPHRWVGRLVAFVVMVSGIALFGIVVAELSSGLTLLRLTPEIQGPADLRGRVVSTVAGSTSIEVLEEYGAQVAPVETIDEAYRRLQARDVEAVVFDSPSLMYYLARNPDPQMTLAGGLFDPQSYGIAFPQGSPLREAVNQALLQTQEDGTYDRIYRKWFGGEQ